MSEVNKLKPEDISTGDVIYCEYKDQGGASWLAIVDKYLGYAYSFDLKATIMLTTNNRNHSIMEVEFDTDQDADLDIIRYATKVERELFLSKLNELQEAGENIEEMLFYYLT